MQAGSRSSVLTSVLNFKATMSSARADKCTQNLSGHGGRMRPAVSSKSAPRLSTSGWMCDDLLKKSETMNWWSGVDVVLCGKGAIHMHTLHEYLGRAIAGT